MEEIWESCSPSKHWKNSLVLKSDKIWDNGKEYFFKNISQYYRKRIEIYYI